MALQAQGGRRESPRPLFTEEDFRCVGGLLNEAEEIARVEGRRCVELSDVLQTAGRVCHLSRASRRLLMRLVADAESSNWRTKFAVIRQNEERKHIAEAFKRRRILQYAFKNWRRVQKGTSLREGPILRIARPQPRALENLQVIDLPRTAKRVSPRRGGDLSDLTLDDPHEMHVLQNQVIQAVFQWERTVLSRMLHRWKRKTEASRQLFQERETIVLAIRKQNLYGRVWNTMVLTFNKKQTSRRKLLTALDHWYMSNLQICMEKWRCFTEHRRLANPPLRSPVQVRFLFSLMGRDAEPILERRSRTNNAERQRFLRTVMMMKRWTLQRSFTAWVDHTQRLRTLARKNIADRLRLCHTFWCMQQFTREKQRKHTQAHTADVVYIQSCLRRTLRSWRAAYRNQILVTAEHRAKNLKTLHSKKRILEGWRREFHLRRIVETCITDIKKRRLAKAFGIWQCRTKEKAMARRNAHNEVQSRVETAALRRGMAKWRRAYRFVTLERDMVCTIETRRIRKILFAWRHRHLVVENRRRLNTLADSVCQKRQRRHLGALFVFWRCTLHIQELVRGRELRSLSLVFHEWRNLTREKKLWNSRCAKLANLMERDGRVRGTVHRSVMCLHSNQVARAFRTWRTNAVERGQLRSLHHIVQNRHNLKILWECFQTWEKITAQAVAERHGIAFHTRRMQAVCLQRWRAYVLVRREKCLVARDVDQQFLSHMLQIVFQRWRLETRQRRQGRFFASQKQQALLRSLFSEWVTRTCEKKVKETGCDVVWVGNLESDQQRPHEMHFLEWRKKMSLHTMFRHWLHCTRQRIHANALRLKILHRLASRALIEWAITAKHHELQRRQMVVFQRENAVHVLRRCYHAWKDQYQLLVTREHENQLRLSVHLHDRNLQWKAAVFSQWRNWMARRILKTKRYHAYAREHLFRRVLARWRNYVFARQLRSNAQKLAAIHWRRSAIRKAFSGWQLYAHRETVHTAIVGAFLNRCEQSLQKVGLCAFKLNLFLCKKGERSLRRYWDMWRSFLRQRKVQHVHMMAADRLLHHKTMAHVFWAWRQVLHT